MKKTTLIMVICFVIGAVTISCISSCRRPPAPRNAVRLKANNNPPSKASTPKQSVPPPKKS